MSWVQVFNSKAGGLEKCGLDLKSIFLLKKVLILILSLTSVDLMDGRKNPRLKKFFIWMLLQSFKYTSKYTDGMSDHF